MNLINELRSDAKTAHFGHMPLEVSGSEMLELLDRLEAAEKSDAESIAMYRKARDERDALRTVLTDLLNDLEERAKWNLEESQRVVACGNGVYMRAKAALEETK